MRLTFLTTASSVIGICVHSSLATVSYRKGPSAGVFHIRAEVVFSVAL